MKNSFKSILLLLLLTNLIYALMLLVYDSESNALFRRNENPGSDAGRL